MEPGFEINMNDFLPLRDVVFNTLRQAILRGELKPGERLMEIKLANKLGVSRTPIREAIRKLELEGLVLIIPRRGAEVAQITEKSLRDVLEVRCALEELSVRLACERMSWEQFEQLRTANVKFAQVAEGEDITEIAKSDEAFHDIIYYSTDNDKLILLLNKLREQMYRYRFVYIQEESRHDNLVAEHREIYESIASRDKERASAAAKLHIDNQEKAIVRQIRMENEGRKFI